MLPLGALSQSIANTFVEQFYLLISTNRFIKLYRGFETAGLRAPFGKDHPSYIWG